MAIWFQREIYLQRSLPSRGVAFPFPASIYSFSSQKVSYEARREEIQYSELDRRRSANWQSAVSFPFYFRLSTLFNSD